MKTKHIIGSAVVAASIIAASAIAIAQSNSKTETSAATGATQTVSAAKDDLDSSYGSREFIAPLKDVERAWLHQMIAEGKLRLATQADKDAWLRVAQSKRPSEELRMLDSGRTFVILDGIEIPPEFPNGERMTGNITFIIASNTPFPKTRAGTPFYDLDSGGWYQGGEWDDGEKKGRGFWPH